PPGQAVGRLRDDQLARGRLYEAAGRSRFVRSASLPARGVATCVGEPERGRLPRGGRVPSVWGLSKEQASYRDAPTPAVQCKVCKFMFPPFAIGSCRFVRG